MHGRCNTCKVICSKLLKCSKCKKAAYCCLACQKEDWSLHRKTCQSAALPTAMDASPSQPSQARLSVVDGSLPKGVHDIADSIVQRLADAMEVYGADRANPDAQAAVAVTCMQRMGATIEQWAILQKRPEVKEVVLGRRMAEDKEDGEIWQLELLLTDAIQSWQRGNTGCLDDRAGISLDCARCMHEAIERWKGKSNGHS